MSIRAQRLKKSMKFVHYAKKNAPAGAFFINAASSALGSGEGAASKDEHAADKEGETQPGGGGAPIF